MKISACIIAKDEADRIVPCLESVAFCDEIVVLDSGSGDDTVRLCQEHGARVIETDWPGWIAQKNRAVEAARHDWILSLDADERVDDALRARIEAIRDGDAAAVGTAALGTTASGTTASGTTALGTTALGGAAVEGAAPVAYEMTRLSRYLGRWIRHGGWYPEWRTRLFDRRHARWGGVDPHDRVEVEGRQDRIEEGNLLHVTYRSLSDHVRQINKFTSVAADEMLARGRRPGLWGMLARPPFHAFRMYVVRRGFLDGWPGFVAAAMYGWYVFLKYAKAWERKREIVRIGARHGDLAAAPIEEAVRAHDEALALDDDRVVKVGPKSRVTRHGDLVVKESRAAEGLSSVKDTLAPNRHAAGYENAKRLQEEGVATARPLAWARVGSRTLTLYEDLSDLPRLDHLVRGLYASGDREAQVRLRDALADWLGTLHARGIYHGDLKAVNVLVRDGDAPVFPLIDTDRVRFFSHPVDRRRRVKNLAQLAASIPRSVSRSERLRFLRRYTSHLPLGEPETTFVKAIQAEVSQRIVVIDEPIE